MKPTGILGLGLLALSGVAVAYWWKNRGSATPGASPDPLKLDSLPALQQVGSNFAENITPDAIKLALDYAQKQVDYSTCWRLSQAGSNLLYDNYCKNGDPDPLKCTLVLKGTYPKTGIVC